MNTLTTGARFKVAGLFRAAYRWMRDVPAPAPAAPSSAVSPSQPPVLKPPPLGAKPPLSPDKPSVPDKPSAVANPLPPAPRAAQPAASESEMLLLPLQVVIDSLPSELKAKVRQPLVGVQTLPVPLAQVMAQLPHGAVRISFGELRRSAPDVFLPATDGDAVMVALPLAEILPRINLGKLGRRNNQQAVQVPEEIVSPFSANGKGLTLAGSTKPPPTAIPVRPVISASPAATLGPAGTAHFVPRSTVPGQASSLHAPIAPRALATSGRPPRAVTPAPLPPSAAPISIRPGPVAPPPRTSRGAPGIRANLPAAPSNLPPSVKPAGGNGQGVVPAASYFIPATPMPEAGPTPITPTECVEVPLAALLNSWPQPVRLEVAQMGAVDASVALPVDVLEKGLRAGRVFFPWKLVRAWLRPAAQPHVSVHDATPLEMPLSIIAPMFVARRNPAGAGHRKVAVDESIPNLFFNGAPPASAFGISNAAPVSAPVAAKTPDTSIFVWGDTDDSRPQVVEAAASPATPSTDFSRRFASPNEIVKRAMALDGVAGALVALPDGLKVASDVPAELNADTLAAFLPQLFSKVSQAAKELRMGALNNLSFTVGNIPWKIFRVHSVYFAAFGRAGESLPKAQLAALATELERKPKAA